MSLLTPQLTPLHWHFEIVVLHLVFAGQQLEMLASGHDSIYPSHLSIQTSVAIGGLSRSIYVRTILLYRRKIKSKY